MSAALASDPERITFVDYQQPSLKSGSYQITVTQTISLDTESFVTTRRFTVAGEGFSLAPAAIGAVFPPDGSLGDHSSVLPHIMLGRAALPWERSPDGAQKPLPWLVLLLFDESERPEPHVIALADLLGANADPPPTPDDRVTVIDVPVDRLRAMMPSFDDLPFLAHIRRTSDGDVAVIIGNRLARPGGTSTMHLVSVEGRYTGGSFNFGSGATVRLVSLASWRFACVDAGQTFVHLVQQLAHNGSPFRLADSGVSAAAPHLEQGRVPIQHRMRQGGRSIAWYRGPFVTGPLDEPPLPPARTADGLLRYDADTGMFDVSYAAAWELGRLLALQSVAFSTALYAWKRRRDQRHKRALPEYDREHPLVEQPLDDALPASVSAWLDQLTQLRGVPFRYLVPDERLLPPESIRFLQIDRQWIACLRDGAYSIGRVTQIDAELDTAYPLPPIAGGVSGAIIRSDVVAGYPGLLIDAYADADGARPVAVLPSLRLSKNIILCLFAGEIARLDVHQQPEALHFAVELAEVAASVSPTRLAYSKRLRSERGPAADPDFGGSSAGTGASSPATPLNAPRTIPFGGAGGLAAQFSGALGVTAAVFTSGRFARQMIESAERVSFTKRS